MGGKITEKNNKINLAAVSYLNTKPLLYGLLHSPLSERLNVVLDIPSACASKLISGAVNLALIPTAVIPLIPNASTFSNFCIGSQNQVKTVGIFSIEPLENLDTLVLDYQSRTSVLLVQILLKEYWKKEIKFVAGNPNQEIQVYGKTGSLIIGDKTMGLHDKYPYFYDLGEAWKAHTGLPFVFAAWVSTHKISREFEELFNQAMLSGLASIPELLLLLPNPTSSFDLKSYFSENIYYQLDEQMKKGMSLFIEKLSLYTKSFFH